MKASFEEKKKEAVDRLRLLNVFPKTVEQFEKDGLISQSVEPLGGLYWIEGEQLERVKEFERDNSACVYLVINGSYQMIDGSVLKMESYLYVSDHPEEWQLDREDIEAGQVFAYVYTVNAPECSEFGAIGIQTTPAGGLRRTW